MAKSPNSYKDPYWMGLASTAEQKSGVTPGLLQSIVIHGEKSNADQVSEKGAKTPFQITPQTRNLAIKQYGIDPYMSDELAAEVAGRLLKDSLDRNGGDISQAAGEYIGGTNRKNWGPKTQAYIDRVTNGTDKIKLDKLGSDFAQWMQDNPATGQTTAPQSQQDRMPQEIDVNSLPDQKVSGSDVPADNQDQNVNPDLAIGFGQYMKQQQQAQQQPQVVRQPTLGEQLAGIGEAALATGTGMTTGALGNAYGSASGIAQSLLNGTFGTQQAADAVEAKANQAAQNLTYQPRTQAGQDIMQNVVSPVMENLAPIAPEVASIAPAAASLRASAPIAAGEAARAASLAGDIGKKTTTAAMRAPAKVAEGFGFREPTEAVQPRNAGAAETEAATRRQTVAEALPVPVQLTKGAATRESGQLAFEKEQMKGPEGAPLRKRAEENNIQVLGNLESVLDNTGGAAVDPGATGNAVIKALSKGYNAAKDQTRIAYQAARNSDEARAPVDAQPLIDHLNSVPGGLKTTTLVDHAKQYAERLGIASRDADGNLVANPTTVAGMEDLRKEISQATGFEPVEQRDSAILKGLIDQQTEPVAGPLYKTARSLRKDQADKYESRAIVARLLTNKKGMNDPQVAVDQVFNKTILNGAPEEISFLKDLMNSQGVDGKQAWNELKAATVKFLRDESTKGLGTDSGDNPLVSPAKLNNAVQRLDANGRLDLILGKSSANIIRDLNDVVQYVNTVPPGTLVNHSGTAGALLGAISEAGLTGALTGLPMPVVSILRALGRQVKSNKIKIKINQALNNQPKQSKGKF
jgi:hypothetical protein